MTAVQFPLAGVFLTVVWFIAFCIWVFLFIAVVTDVFRSRDLGGAGKALWCILVFVLPVVGALAYLAVRGGSMHERAEHTVGRQEARLDRYVHRAVGAPPPSTGVGATPEVADERAVLLRLHDRGVLDDQELAAALARLER